MMQHLDNLMAGGIMLLSSFFPSIFQESVSKVHPTPLMTGAVVIEGLSPAEERVVRDAYFRYFITAMGQIEENYSMAGTLNTEKLMIGALKGALAYGTGDKYSGFIPNSELEKYQAENLDGENDLSATWRILNRRYKLAYVRISSFYNETSIQFDDVVSGLMRFKPRGLVIDLRGNHGGISSAVQDIMMYLVPPGTAFAKFADHDGSETVKYPTRNDLYRNNDNRYPKYGAEFLRDLPIIILINGSTASSAEIMAMGLRDLGRAVLVGSKSYGKGTFQHFMASTLGWTKMTGGGWYSREGVSIHLKGLMPDVKVKDTRKNGRGYDLQLHKAITILRQEIRKKRE